MGRYFGFLRQNRFNLTTSTVTRPRIQTTTILTSKDPLILPRYYWPNYGYEPYWADGNWWLRDPAKDLAPNQTTTKIPLVCGEECNFMNMRIGEVCGHRSDKYGFGWCWGSKDCKGHNLRDVFPQHFKTFKTYCEFLNAQCRDDVDRWGLVHRGPCVEEDKQYTFLKPLMPQESLVNRMHVYLDTWKKTLYDKEVEQGGGTTKPPPTTMSTPGG